MTRRSVAVMGGLVVVAAVSLMPMLVRGQKPAANNTPNTPWGEPDLQGIWYAFEDAPLQRPAEYAGRELLTEEEFAAKMKRPAWLERVAEGTRDPSKRQG